MQPPGFMQAALSPRAMSTRACRVIGIDTASGSYSQFKDGMVSGDFPAADDREGVLIGKRLAEKLED